MPRAAGRLLRLIGKGALWNPTSAKTPLDPEVSNALHGRLLEAQFWRGKDADVNVCSNTMGELTAYRVDQDMEFSAIRDYLSAPRNIAFVLGRSWTSHHCVYAKIDRRPDA